MDHHHPPFSTTTTATTTAHDRAEAERLLTISSKLLETRDLSGAREFALLAQESDPSLPGSDHVVAISDVLLADDQRVDSTPHHHSILQTRPGSDPTHIESNYRRLSLLLHPDTNKYPLAGSAFGLVSEAYAALSKTAAKLPVRRNNNNNNNNNNNPNSGNAGDNARDTFWTACPYCFVLYEYLSVYKDCCIRCRKCRRTFHGAELPSLPPEIDGVYYSWGFFPVGISVESQKNVAFPNWVPAMKPLSASNGVNINLEETWTE